MPTELSNDVRKMNLILNIRGEHQVVNPQEIVLKSPQGKQPLKAWQLEEFTS